MVYKNIWDEWEVEVKVHNEEYPFKVGDYINSKFGMILGKILVTNKNRMTVRVLLHTITEKEDRNFEITNRNDTYKLAEFI
jgi:hypothetical protein